MQCRRMDLPIPERGVYIQANRVSGMVCSTAPTEERKVCVGDACSLSCVIGVPTLGRTGEKPIKGPWCPPRERKIEKSFFPSSFAIPTWLGTVLAKAYWHIPSRMVHTKRCVTPFVLDYVV